MKEMDDRWALRFLGGRAWLAQDVVQYFLQWTDQAGHLFCGGRNRTSCATQGQTDRCNSMIVCEHVVHNMCIYEQPPQRALTDLVNLAEPCPLPLLDNTFWQTLTV